MLGNRSLPGGGLGGHLGAVEFRDLGRSTEIILLPDEQGTVCPPSPEEDRQVILCRSVQARLKAYYPFSAIPSRKNPLLPHGPAKPKPVEKVVDKYPYLGGKVPFGHWAETMAANMEARRLRQEHIRDMYKPF